MVTTIRGAFHFLLAIGFSLAAQTISITGKVSNQSGNPISGAIVTLQGRKLSVTTNGDGSFEIIQTTALSPLSSPILPNSEKISLYNGIVSISLMHPTRVKIEMFDLRGVLLGQILDHRTIAGKYRFDLNTHPLSKNIMLVRVSTGRSSMVFRSIHLNNGRQVTNSSTTSISSNGNTLAKLHATVDVLNISASGYVPKEVPISSYEEKNVIITLDTITLPHFSFFVTSLEGLQRLSKSADGFGGDFRFGHTGPGAGLKGADSICECLAESSMEGAKVKIWRAFLSAKQGEDGNVVNAIDRIGEGPWYDRIGRLLANNKSELLNERPINADPAIKNDFPNEFGIPNHRPDPTQPEVDNHVTITGSNKEGLLYNHERDGGSAFTRRDTTTRERGFSVGQYPEEPTCDDWTSTTAQSSPQAGFSWPQSEMDWRDMWEDWRNDSTTLRKKMIRDRDTTRTGWGMSHWISVFAAHGCEPGIDLEYNTGPGVRGINTIGNGGGYGGFYCFALNP